MRRLKIIVEEHADGFVAYPLGVKGVVVGQGDSSENALADVKSAIRFHIESFGAESFDASAEILNAYLAETELADWAGPLGPEAPTQYGGGDAAHASGKGRRFSPS